MWYTRVKRSRIAGRKGDTEVKEKVLLAVPHQDDELFVGGGFFKTLAQSGDYEAYVVFMTNGDFFAHEAEARLRESLHVLTKLYGIEESHIFFLGYGDGWKDTGIIRGRSRAATAVTAWRI